jgi:hypothetical protein
MVRKATHLGPAAVRAPARTIEQKWAKPPHRYTNDEPGPGWDPDIVAFICRGTVAEARKKAENDGFI